MKLFNQQLAKIPSCFAQPSDGRFLHTVVEFLDEKPPRAVAFLQPSLPVASAVR